MEEENQELQKAVLDMAEQLEKRSRRTIRKGKLKKVKMSRRVQARSRKKERYPRTMMTVTRRRMGLITH